MDFKKRASSQPVRWGYFALFLVVATLVYSLYAVNIVVWRNSPDFGWRTMYESGPNFVAEVMESGRAAGLRAGDRIVAINGLPYTTFDELYFKVRRNEEGSVNTYTVQRDGVTKDISITTGRLGLKATLVRSGPIFAVGLLYALIGVLVFLMKPQASESWLFLFMSTLFGMEISYGAPSDLLRPLWVNNIRFVIDAFFPAPLIHLGLTFPKTRSFLKRRPWLRVAPYALSILLLLLYAVTSRAFWDAPVALTSANVGYLLVGVLVFLVSMLWNSLKDPSVVVRRQSQVIFIGIMLGFFIPTFDLVSREVWKVHLFPSPALGFAVFLTMFPLSIGYTIVKHDLFAIDVIVRRAYGYMLSTATVIGAYAWIVLLLNMMFHSSRVYQSPLFSILFALGVVFFFRPLHERIQMIVDRIFYRQHYDYRKTIKGISEAMISILDSDQIRRRLIDSVVKEMFLDNGLLLLPDPRDGTYRVQVAEGSQGIDLACASIDGSDTLPRLLKEQANGIFRFETDLNPAYESYRTELEATFQCVASELMLPLMYKDEMRGIISLGRKKSGKMFTLEDLDLLKTISNQSAIALENARLFEENLEKCRMEEELKIAHDLQTSMLPEKAPTIQGFAIAARSISAREVGGDFYDFIEVGCENTCTKLAIVVGDVSGKAVSGALVMAASRSIFRVLTEANASVKDVMNTGNSRLMDDIKKGMFVALLYAVLDGERRILTLSNAGQTQPVLCSDDGSTPFYIDTEGDKFPLGILRECDYEETSVPLKRGDTVVFYTDGVVEAMDEAEELYGFERLLASIQEGSALGADALLEKVMEDVTDFVGGVEQHDDLTLVVVKVE
ncbi:MAG: SpoIIE family protein phosphatase [Syntrophobacteraceae bacterium]